MQGRCGKLFSEKGFYVSDARVISMKGKHYLIGFATNNWKPTVFYWWAKREALFYVQYYRQAINC